MTRVIGIDQGSGDRTSIVVGDLVEGTMKITNVRVFVEGPDGEWTEVRTPGEVDRTPGSFHATASGDITLTGHEALMRLAGAYDLVQEIPDPPRRPWEAPRQDWKNRERRGRRR